METYKKVTDHAFWQTVRTADAYARHRRELEKNWESLCCQPVEALPYHQFRRYYLDGDRRSFEKFYFGRRQALNTACFLSLLYPEEPQYLEKAQDLIFAMCNEFTWVLPAHQKTLEGFNPVHIDLFAAESALNLSEIYVLLEHRLDAFLLRRIREEIRRRILEPYKSRTFGWESAATNWTAVCTCGVAIALCNLFPEEAKALLPRFYAAADSFLSGFGDDGYCLEGPMYWGYGFGFFTALAERLRSFGGEDLFRLPKVERIASFFQKVTLCPGVELTFADADMGTHYSLGIQHFLHREYPDTVTIPPEENSSLTDRMARMCLHLRSFMWYDPQAQSSQREGIHFGADSQWLIARQRAYGFAAKGGHNDEPHNHNDIGSFIFAKNGRQVLTDPGRAQYCRDYFAAETRYSFLHTASRGHSVPIVGGQYQQAGKEFAAQAVVFDGKTLSLELCGAYGAEGLQSLHRSFSLEDGGVTLTDRICAAAPITERLIATEPPAATEGQLIWSDATVTFSPAVLPTVTRTENTVDDNRQQVLYLIDIPLPPGTEEFTCKMA